MNKPPEKLMSKAFVQLMYNHPFYASIGMRLEREAVDPSHPRFEEIKTFATDGYRIYFNTEWIQTLTNAQIQGVIVHEIMHVINLHQLRQGPREHKRWNAACDYAIDPSILAEKFELPDGGHVNPAWADMSAEQIYDLLPEGTGSGDGDGPGIGAILPNSKGKGATPTEIRAEQARIKDMVNSAVVAAQQAGKLPQFAQRLIDELNIPKHNWKETLARFLTERVPTAPSWRTPNRRYIAQGLYLPGRNSTNDGHIVVAIDTSGSISDEVLNEFGTEVRSIVETLAPRLVTVIYCDAAVQHVDQFKRYEELTFKLYGGGGTDFAPVFTHILEEDLQPSALVYLTDGYGQGFPVADYPVLWAINNKQVIPTSGEHIVLV